MTQQRLAEENRRTRELENAATELLAQSAQEHGQSEYPYYTERWLREMQRREESASLAPAPGEAVSSELSLLLDALLAGTLLPQSQRVTVTLYRAGLSLRAIAARTGCCPTTAHRRLRRGLDRLRAAATAVMEVRQSPGLIAHVYRLETRNRDYAPERHCAPGREACRHDGLCRYRWYLYHLAEE
jgi:DNA-directed RNA polymerase specialized sigma24 family protein